MHFSLKNWSFPLTYSHFIALVLYILLFYRSIVGTLRVIRPAEIHFNMLTYFDLQLMYYHSLIYLLAFPIHASFYFAIFPSVHFLKVSSQILCEIFLNALVENNFIPRGFHGDSAETWLNNALALVTSRNNVFMSLRVMRRRAGSYWDKYFIRIGRG